VVGVVAFAVEDARLMAWLLPVVLVGIGLGEALRVRDHPQWTVRRSNTKVSPVAGDMPSDMAVAWLALRRPPVIASISVDGTPAVRVRWCAGRSPTRSLE
jgi:hypothetical protein